MLVRPRSIAARLRQVPGALGRHRWYTAGGVIIVVAAAVTVYEVTSSTSSSPSAAATVSYRLVAAAQGTVRESVSSTGTIEPADDDSLNFAVSGTVTSVTVAQGDTVKKGQVLATIDSASLRASLAQAQASLATAQAKVASDQDSSASADQLTADQAAESAASGQVTSAQAALADANLTSPIDGVVASTNISVGQSVSGSGGSGGSGSGSGGTGGAGGNSGSNANSNASSSSSSSSAQFEVISTSSWLVEATVDATGVGLVKKGDQAQIITTGATGTVYGLISSVGVIASSSSSGSASFPVVVAITGDPSGLHAGATATVSLIYKQLVNVLTVPTLAVHTSTDGSSVVWQSASGKLDGSHTTKAVTVGLSSGGVTQIVSGLSAGDEVLEQTVSLRRSATSTTGGSTRTGGGGFTGGGFTGGGFTGGGFTGGGFTGGGFPGGGAAPVGGN